MLTERELQTLRNMGNEAEAAADEIVSLRAELAALKVPHVPIRSVCQHVTDPRGCYRVRCQLGRKCAEPIRQGKEG